MRKLALVSSYLLHPMLLLPAMMAVMAWLLPFASFGLGIPQKWFIVIATVLYGCLLPLSAVLLLRLTGRVQGIYLANRSERHLPLLFSAVSLCYGFNTLDHMQLPPFFSGLMLAAGLTLAICFGVNFWVKLSNHAAGCAALLGFFLWPALFGLGELRPLLACLLLLNGFVVSCRLTLQAHSPRELAVGFAAGIAGGSAGWWLVLIL